MLAWTWRLPVPNSCWIWNTPAKFVVRAPLRQFKDQHACGFLIFFYLERAPHADETVDVVALFNVARKCEEKGVFRLVAGPAAIEQGGSALIDHQGHRRRCLVNERHRDVDKIVVFRIVRFQRPGVGVTRRIDTCEENELLGLWPFGPDKQSSRGDVPSMPPFAASSASGA